MIRARGAAGDVDVPLERRIVLADGELDHRVTLREDRRDRDPRDRGDSQRRDERDAETHVSFLPRGAGDDVDALRPTTIRATALEGVSRARQVEHDRLVDREPGQQDNHPTSHGPAPLHGGRRRRAHARARSAHLVRRDVVGRNHAPDPLCGGYRRVHVRGLATPFGPCCSPDAWGLDRGDRRQQRRPVLPEQAERTWAGRQPGEPEHPRGWRERQHRP